ncbi:MAG: hypothetical protein DMD33_18275 [Gemmatimonadetes bacterium]|nr:MAG: hypothetical protein DMD33_18275 [Gemmatimonadota bacterium]
MPRYAALLRGVMPMNARMSDLKAAFEAAGFTDVKTVLASGDVVFKARSRSAAALERKIETALERRLDTGFLTIVRSIEALSEVLASDPYRAFRLDPTAKRIVTFLRDRPKAKLTLPIERDGARILRVAGTEVFSAYTRTPKGPVFMALIEKTFGQVQTTRTWDTVVKVARA